MAQELSFPFEDKFMDLKNKGVLRYWEAGDKSKPKIVFLHGIGSGIESWFAQFGCLSNHFFVTAVDIPGFGKSRIADNNCNLEAFLNILDLFIKSKEFGQLSFIGHSLGGYLALEYANAHPAKIKKLILIASGGFGLPSKRFRFLGNRFSQLFLLPFVKTDFLGPKIFRYFYGNGLPAPAYESLSRHWKDLLVMKSFVKILKQSDEQKSVNVSSITSPSLIIWGRKDWVLDYHLGIIAESRLPNSKLRLFDKFSHGIHTEIPEIINPLILEFLSSD